MLTITTDSLAGPGGAADAGETPDDAIIRETQEEYGLEVTIVPVQGKKVFAKTNDCLSDGSFWCCNFYLLELNDKKQVPQVCHSFTVPRSFIAPTGSCRCWRWPEKSSFVLCPPPREPLR